MALVKMDWLATQTCTMLLTVLVLASLLMLQCTEWVYQVVYTQQFFIAHYAIDITGCVHEKSVQYDSELGESL